MLYNFWYLFQKYFRHINKSLKEVTQLPDSYVPIKDKIKKAPASYSRFKGAKEVYVIKRVGKRLVVQSSDRPAKALGFSFKEDFIKDFSATTNPVKIRTIGLSKAQIGRVIQDLATIPNGMIAVRKVNIPKNSAISYEILVDKEILNEEK